MKNTVTIFSITSVLFSLLVMSGSTQIVDALPTVTIDLTKLATYNSGIFGGSAAEIYHMIQRQNDSL